MILLIFYSMDSHRTIVIGCGDDVPQRKIDVKCDICQKEFSTNVAKNLHHLRAHKRKTKVKKKQQPRKKLQTLEAVPEANPGKSEKCDKQFDVVQFTSVTCSSCSEEFQTFEKYLSHQAKFDCPGESYFLLRSEETFKCHKCPASFTREEDRLEHLGQHLVCPDCDAKKFQDITAFRVHMKKQHGRSPCYACHLAFSTVSGLKNHLVDQHSNVNSLPDKPLKDIVSELIDEVKDRTFLEELILKRYPTLAGEIDLVWRAKLRQAVSSLQVQNQSREPPKETSYFLCGQCRSSFPDKGQLAEHLKHCCVSKNPEVKRCKSRRSKASEGKVKFHMCRGCDAKFHWKVDLRNHMRREHEAMLNRCNTCQQSFSAVGFLNRHTAICSNKVLALILGKEDDE